MGNCKYCEHWSGSEAAYQEHVCDGMSVYDANGERLAVYTSPWYSCPAFKSKTADPEEPESDHERGYDILRRERDKARAELDRIKLVLDTIAGVPALTQDEKHEPISLENRVRMLTGERDKLRTTLVEALNALDPGMILPRTGSILVATCQRIESERAKLSEAVEESHEALGYAGVPEKHGDGRGMSLADRIGHLHTQWIKTSKKQCDESKELEKLRSQISDVWSEIDPNGHYRAGCVGIGAACFSVRSDRDKAWRELSELRAGMFRVVGAPTIVQSVAHMPAASVEGVKHWARENGCMDINLWMVKQGDHHQGYHFRHDGKLYHLATNGHVKEVAE